MAKQKRGRWVVEKKRGQWWVFIQRCRTKKLAQEFAGRKKSQGLVVRVTDDKPKE